jgi:hypothetical protein
MIVDGTIQQGDLGFSAGDVTAVWSGEGLNGGGSQGDLSLSVENPLELTGSSYYGVIRGTHTDGNYGYLGGGNRAVCGRRGDLWGSLGSGVSGACGQDDASGNFGQLGTADYGVYGESSTGSAGFLGAPGCGVQGWHYAGGHAGVLGFDWCGVYYSGGLAGTGTKDCIVRTSQGPTRLHCQESPEHWFEDFGEGCLVNGRAHVELDALFLETVTIDGSHPMKVFVQLGGDCNGVYVAKGATGFDVVELRSGTSSVPFDYRIVAKRAGFEEGRLQVCEQARTDPYLYPEFREKQIREREERNREREGAARLEREAPETAPGVTPER